MIQETKPRFQQVGELLDYLSIQPERVFNGFCKCLRDTNQGHLADFPLSDSAASEYCICLNLVLNHLTVAFIAAAGRSRDTFQSEMTKFVVIFSVI